MNARHRWTEKRRAAARIEAALADPDPGTRRAAIHVAADRGLRTFAAALAERARVEQDDAIRRTLVQVVLDNEWEPSDSHDLVELRLWARTAAVPPVRQAGAPAARVAGPPTPDSMAMSVARGGNRRAVDAASTVAGSTVAGSTVAGSTFAGSTVAGSTVAGSTVAGSTVAGSTSVGTLVRAGPVAARSPRAGERPGPESDTSPATTIVTGAGGAAGVSVIRALMAAGHRVVGVDADTEAVGARLADEAAAIPRADHPLFVAALCRLAATAGATVLISTVAEEMLALAEAEDELAAAGLASWVPHPEAVRACEDKWIFAQIMVRAGIPVPPTNLGSTAGVPGPWVVKPRFGRGSRDVHVAMTQEEADWALARVPGAMVQTRLEGTEFSVDTLVDRDGRLAGAVPRWRLETKAGISTRGRTFVDLPLVDMVAEVLETVRLRGPANVQGFMTPDGTPSFIEVNPRFSGGLPLSLAAGADLVGEYLRGVLGQPVRPEELLFRPGVSMFRYFEEIFE